MKTKIFLSLIAMLVLPGLAHANTCASAFDSPEIKWRSAQTNLNQSGDVSATSNIRERHLKSSIKQMENSVNRSSTPIMALFPAEGQTESYLVKTRGYQSGIISRMEVGNLGESGVYKGTLVLPVSGHDGVTKAKQWATTDTYSIHMESAAGTVTLIKDAPSKDIVTLQEIEIPLKRGEVVKILYDRSGSAGPGGFPEGRIIEFVWDGT